MLEFLLRLVESLFRNLWRLDRSSIDLAGGCLQSADILRKTSFVLELRTEMIAIGNHHHTQDVVLTGAKSGPVKEHSQDVKSTCSGYEGGTEYASQD